MSRPVLRYLLGALWLVDGFLQLQPRLWTVRLVATTTQAAAALGADRAASLANLLVRAAQIEARHVELLNAAIGVAELALGVLLITGRWLRAALVFSILFALGVWALGEGFGSLATGTALMLTGAPGAALLYAFLALLVFPKAQAATTHEGAPSPQWLVGRKGVRLLNAGLWFLAAALQLQPAVAGSQGLWHLYVGTGMMGGGILRDQPAPVGPSFACWTRDRSMSPGSRCVSLHL